MVPASPSVRSRTLVSGSMPVSFRIFFAVERPTPYTYVSPTSILFSRGRSTPAMRAIFLALPLLVTGVRADHTHHPAPAYHLAPLADGLHARPYLQSCSFLFITLPEPVSYTSPVEVIGAELHLDFVSRQDPDVIHPHLARNMS